MLTALDDTIRRYFMSLTMDITHRFIADRPKGPARRPPHCLRHCIKAR